MSKNFNSEACQSNSRSNDDHSSPISMANHLHPQDPTVDQYFLCNYCGYIEDIIIIDNLNNWNIQIICPKCKFGKLRKVKGYYIDVNAKKKTEFKLPYKPKANYICDNCSHSLYISIQTTFINKNYRIACPNCKVGKLCKLRALSDVNQETPQNAEVNDLPESYQSDKVIAKFVCEECEFTFCVGIIRKSNIEEHCPRCSFITIKVKEYNEFSAW